MSKYREAVTEDPELHLLSKGCSGPEVTFVQGILRAAGIRDDDGDSLDMDGEFGAKTEQAVKAMQKRLGLDADGEVGKDTWTAMLKRMECGERFEEGAVTQKGGVWSPALFDVT